ncbi:unnamed protein product, partial [Mesorhabditis spiculigera]
MAPTIYQMETAQKLYKKVDGQPPVQPPIDENFRLATLDPETDCFAGYGCDNHYKILGVVVIALLVCLVYTVLYALRRRCCSPSGIFLVQPADGDQQKLLDNERLPVSVEEDEDGAKNVVRVIETTEIDEIGLCNPSHTDEADAGNKLFISHGVETETLVNAQTFYQLVYWPVVQKRMGDVECSTSGNVRLRKGYIFGKRWIVGVKLGEGGCGTVYKVSDKKTGDKFALKTESNNIEGGSVLKLEAQVLRKLEGKLQFPQIRWAGKRTKFSYVVMTLLGDSLHYLLRLHGSRVNTVSTQIRVGIQLLHALKMMHDAGIVHRDVKPANLAMGHQDGPQAHILHILDFGLARDGTSRYCSINTHKKGEQGRADDLWSMIYLMAEMRCSLPWARMQEKKDVEICKENTSDDDLFPRLLSKVTAHLRTLGYYDRPDYLYIYRIFNQIRIDEKINYDDLYDWEEAVKGEPAQHKDSEKVEREMHAATKDQPPSRQVGEASSTSVSENSTEASKTASNEKLTKEDELNLSDTQDDPEMWGEFPVEDYARDPLAR